jgi:hypothetical protein
MAAGQADGTYVYEAGGYSFTSAALDVLTARSVANTWMTLPVCLPRRLWLQPFITPTNKIYVFGGEDAISGTNYNVPDLRCCNRHVGHRHKYARRAQFMVRDTTMPTARSI